MQNKGQANEGPRLMDRDAQALKQSKLMKEPAVTDYRDSLGKKEMREVRCARARPRHILLERASEPPLTRTPHAPLVALLPQTKAEEKAMSTVKALEQKEGEGAVTQLPRK